MAFIMEMLPLRPFCLLSSTPHFRLRYPWVAFVVNAFGDLLAFLAHSITIFYQNHCIALAFCIIGLPYEVGLKTQQIYFTNYSAHARAFYRQAVMLSTCCTLYDFFDTLKIRVIEPYAG